MIIDKINCLKRKLESQIEKHSSYEDIYKTSVEIDELLIEYYKEYNLTQKT